MTDRRTPHHISDGRPARRRRAGLVLTTAIATAGVAGTSQDAAAALPVIDVASLVQLTQQITYWRQQLLGMTNQLTQLRSTYAAITGSRGMQTLLPITARARNYLPEDWQQLLALADQAGAGYNGLSTQIEQLMRSNAVLDAAALARLSPEDRTRFEADRRQVATLQASMREAFSSTSRRFTTLQTLIDRIGAATDDKAIQDLQGRIAAEQAMLANEQTKLLALAAVGNADAEARANREREQVVEGHGSFGQRFTPALP